MWIVKCVGLIMMIQLLIIDTNVIAQNNQVVDSLKQALIVEKTDSNKVLLRARIGELTWLFRISYWDSIATDARVLGMAHSEGHALNNMGFISKEKGNDLKAIEYFEKSIAVYKTIPSLESIAGTYNNIADVYYHLGQVERSLELHTLSLKIKEKINDQEGISNSLNNIGLIYYNQGEVLKAIEYHRNAAAIKLQLDDKSGYGTALNNIGLDHYKLGNIDSAIYYFQSSLNIYLDNQFVRGINLAYNNLAGIHKKKGELDKALGYYLKSLNLRDSIGDSTMFCQSYANIADTYYRLKQYDSAKINGEKALVYAKLFKRPRDIEQATAILHKVYKELGDYKKSILTYELNILMRDSLQNLSTQKATVRSEMLYEFEKEKIGMEKEQEKIDILNQEEAKQKNIVLMAVILGLLLVLISLYFLYQRIRVIRLQKEMIEEKNQEIMDSITYAKRIQNAILPPAKVVKEYLKESFILYKPKDVVAGDFYWMEQKEGKVLFAAADCTGHGVPGAMVSVVCNNGLNRSVREYGLTDPGKILDKTRAIVIQEFEKSEEEVKDGMDIALCSLEGNKLQYAGAHNPLWIIRNGELIETKANKQPIGQFDHPEPYTTHSFDLEQGDSLYIFSDGYVDQFGGVKGKKFKTRAFRDLLLSIQDKPMEEQKTVIDEAFETWRGNLEQIDDVCVIGVRV